MIQAIALDDEPPALQLINNYCARLEYIDLQKTFTASDEALKYLKKHPVDLLFLDIQMPGILGTDFCKLIDNNVMVVFSTAYSEYAVAGFELEVVDFLLKPYDFARFEKAAEKVKTYYNYIHQRATSSNPFIFLRADYSLVKIPLNDLLYIEGLEDYSKFYFDNDEPPMIFRATMKSLIEKLPENQFVRVHRSFIVRMDKVERLKGSSLSIGNREISIGRIYKEQAIDNFNKYSSDTSE